LGTILGPLIENPFVRGEPDNDNKNQTNPGSANFSTTVSSLEIITADERKKSLIKPFFLIGSLFILSAIMVLLMFIFRRYKYQEENQEIEGNDETKSTEPDITNSRNKLSEQIGSPNKLIIGLSAFCIGTYTAVESACFQFIPAFAQYRKLRLSASKSTLLLSAMAIAYTVFRGLSIFIAIKVKPQYMLCCHYCIIFISCLILLLSENSLLMLWIGDIMIGVGLSAMVFITIHHDFGDDILVRDNL
jgi:Na+/melibiose symporter-like transporter